MAGATKRQSQRVQPLINAAAKGNTNMDDADLDRIHRLLQIIDGVRQLPNLKAIHDASMKELEEMAYDIANPEKEKEEVTNERRS